ncbi:MAG: hypothetical protein V2A73_02880, partial [Pseudomonadota bacterium]
LDRWGEFLVFGGLAVLLRSQLGVAAVILAMAGSQMVSYTRARGEALGCMLAGGTMQRAERIATVGVAMLAGAIGSATKAFDGRLVLSLALLVVGFFTAATSIHRLVTGFAALRAHSGTTPPPANCENDDGKHLLVAEKTKGVPSTRHTHPA